MMPEKKLWNLLKNRQCGGLKFRRQHPIGPYTVDFYCAEAGLVVELDGGSHARREGRDAARDAYMRALGLEILRITVMRFEQNPTGAVERIRRAAERRTEKKE